MLLTSVLVIFELFLNIWQHFGTLFLLMLKVLDALIKWINTNEIILYDLTYSDKLSDFILLWILWTLEYIIISLVFLLELNQNGLDDFVDSIGNNLWHSDCSVLYKDWHYYLL